MSLNIASTSGRVEHQDTPLDDLAAFSWLLWLFQTSTAGAQAMVGKNSADSGRKSLTRKFGDVDDYEFQVNRATANGFAETTGVARPLNDWHCVAATYDETDGPRVFFANGVGPLLVEASYSTRTVGTGATNDDGVTGVNVGNRTEADEGFQGRVAVFLAFNTRLSLSDLIAQQFHPTVRDDSLLLCHLGYNGLTSVVDWSGNDIDGVLQGASVTVADHVPLGPLFGYDQDGLEHFDIPGTKQPFQDHPIGQGRLLTVRSY